MKLKFYDCTDRLSRKTFAHRLFPKCNLCNLIKLITTFLEGNLGQ